MKKISFSILLTVTALVSMGAQFGVQTPSLEKIAYQLDSQQGQWIAMKSNITLQFETGGEAASCRGDLLYHRLDEKILLKCFNEEQKLLFIFKTNDWNFELYLPAQETVFTGNIFDLEESQDLESHLKPLAFYRALKVMRFPIVQTEIETWNSEKVYLRVFSGRGDREYISRRIEMTSDGNVVKEIYYHLEERPAITIYRSAFKSIESSFGQKNSFPHNITIEEHLADNPSSIDKTEIAIDGISFTSGLNPKDWNFETPSKVKRTTVRDRILPVVAGS